MGTALIVILVVLGGAALFALAWWSSGRTKKVRPRRNLPGEVSQGEARFESHLNQTRQSDAGNYGSPF
jgi:hypothetical protein